MTRQEMQNKLDRKDISGVGVKVTFDFSSGETGTTYYFYEDFEDDKGVDRAARHFQILSIKGRSEKQNIFTVSRNAPPWSVSRGIIARL